MDFFFAVNRTPQKLYLFIYLFVHLYVYLHEFICPVCMQGAEETIRGWWYPGTAATCQ